MDRRVVGGRLRAEGGLSSILLFRVLFAGMRQRRKSTGGIRTPNTPFVRKATGGDHYCSYENDDGF